MINGRLSLFSNQPPDIINQCLFRKPPLNLFHQSALAQIEIHIELRAWVELVNHVIMIIIIMFERLFLIETSLLHIQFRWLMNNNKMLSVVCGPVLGVFPACTGLDWTAVLQSHILTFSSCQSLWGAGGESQDRTGESWGQYCMMNIILTEIRSLLAG